MVKQLKRQALLSLLICLLLLISLTAATLAWFTNSPDMNVNPMEGQIGTNGGTLLISNAREGEYDLSCKLLVPQSFSQLSPVSTADLTHFYRAGEQSPDDLIVSFLPADHLVDSEILHGHVYLKAEQNDADVYFDPRKLDFGADTQALAALRFGLRIQMEDDSVSSFIFRMDEFKNVTAAHAKATIPSQYSGMVVASVSGSDFRMVKDPARALTDYFAKVEETEEETTFSAGKQMLCTIKEGTIADAEYWLYLEGCDENCFNEVKQKNVALQLAFFGDMPEAEAEED